MTVDEFLKKVEDKADGYNQIRFYIQNHIAETLEFSEVWSTDASDFTYIVLKKEEK